MRKIFFKLIWVGIISSLLVFPILASAQVQKIVFTTEPQTINPGEISGIISIQLQNAAGESSPAPETFDVEFVSSSAIGEFLSPASENPVTKTIATGSANKNFRYRDTANGSFTLTITATGRNSGESWSATQTIVVGSSVGSPPDASPKNPNTSDTSSADSVHYSAHTLNTKKPETITSLSAGRDRIGSVGSPIEFKAETNLSNRRNTEFRWNFGDGSEGYGREISHTYEYPGEYVVVLNLTTPGGRAVARINVKIADPQLNVTLASPERIEIRNDTKQEVSLYGWALWYKGASFLFPQDTIIKPNQSIAFSSRITKLTPPNIQEVQLLSVGQTEQPKINEKIEALKQDKISQLQYQIWTLQEEMASRTVPRPTTLSSVVSTTTLSQESSVTAAALESLPEEKLSNEKGWLTTLKKFFLRK